MKRLLPLFALIAVPFAAAVLAQVSVNGVPPALAAPVQLISGSANQVSAVNGTAAAPSISFASAPTAGMYSATALAIGFSVNSAIRVAVDSSGSNNQLTLANGTQLAFASGSSIGNSADFAISRVAAGEFGLTAVAFAALGTPGNGTFAYCSDCTIANPCAGAGTGALAKRLNGVWVCS